MKKEISTSLDLLENTARDIAKTLKGGEILALIGPLGAGKTSLTQKLAKHLKISHPVTSPTFVLMNVFKGKLANKKSVFFYHLDLYRTKNFKEIKALGITEIWGLKNTITVIEWADKIKKYLPKNAQVIKFKN